MLWLVALGLLLLFDVLLFSANVFKIHEGGWLPLVVAIVVFTLMMTWRRGRRLLSEMQQRPPAAQANSWSSWRNTRRRACPAPPFS